MINKRILFTLIFREAIWPEVVTLVDELAAKEVLAQIHHELTGVAPLWACALGNRKASIIYYRKLLYLYSFGYFFSPILNHGPDIISLNCRKLLNVRGLALLVSHAPTNTTNVADNPRMGSCTKQTINCGKLDIQWTFGHAQPLLLARTSG